MTEVICLFALVLDCFYRCCWFLPLEFSNFGLGLKGSIFLFIVHYMRTVAVFVCWNLLVLPSPTLAHGIKYEMWLPLVLPFFVYFFSCSVCSLLLFCGYFEYFQPCLRHWSMALENGFLMLSKLDIQIWKKKVGSGVSRTTSIPGGRLFGTRRSIFY